MHKVNAFIENVSWIKNTSQIKVEGYSYIKGINIDESEKVKKSAIVVNGDKKYFIPVKNILRKDITEKINDGFNYDYSGFEFSIIASFLDDMKPLDDGEWCIELYINFNGSEHYISPIIKDNYILLKEKVINYIDENKIYRIAAKNNENNNLIITSKSEIISFMRLKIIKHKILTNIKNSKLYKNSNKLLINTIYSLFCLLPIKENGVAFLTDSGSMNGNFKFMYDYMNNKEKFDLKYICNKNIDKKSLYDKIRTFYYLARYKTIFLDDFYPPLNKIKLRKDIRVVQLWHATGAFKKFGFSRKGKPGWNKDVEKRKHHRDYTYAIVSSNNLVKHYSEAFRINPNKIVSTGVPRTDIFFDDEYKNNKIYEILEKYPIIKNKKVILFAPTYRGEVLNGYYDFNKLDILKLIKYFREDYIVILKLHQFIKNRPNWIDTYNDFVIDLSLEYEINDLFFISDIMITDYSSVVFEYSLLNKPMIFFTYDLYDYINKRDFYYPYESFVPGPIAYNTDEIIDIIKNNRFEIEKLKDFRIKFFDHFDGKSTERVYNLLFNK